MKRGTLLLLLLFILIPTPTGLTATAPDPLWEKALAIARSNEGWIAGLTLAQFEIMNKKGKVEHVYDAKIKTVQNKDGTIDYHVESNFPGAAGTKKNSPGSKNGSGMNIFGPGFTWLSVRNTSVTMEINGETCIVYTYRVQNDDKGQVFHGRAWLEQKSGAVLKATFDPDPLPKDVSAQNTEIYYQYQPGSYWYPVTIESTQTRKLFLFGEKVIQSTFKFQEYFRAK